MKKLTTVLIAIGLCLSMVIPVFAVLPYDFYKQLENYEPFRVVSYEEHHELMMNHRGMTAEQILEYEINKAAPGEFIPISLRVKITPELNELLIEKREDRATLRDDPIWDDITGLAVEFLQKFDTDDIKVHQITRGYLSMEISVKKEIVEDVISDESVTDVYYGISDAFLTDCADIDYDLNGDGEINNEDVTFFVRMISGWNSGAGLSYVQLDMNYDWAIDLKDVRYLIIYIENLNNMAE